MCLLDVCLIQVIHMYMYSQLNVLLNSHTYVFTVLFFLSSCPLKQTYLLLFWGTKTIVNYCSTRSIVNFIESHFHTVKSNIHWYSENLVTVKSCTVPKCATPLYLSSCLLCVILVEFFSPLTWEFDINHFCWILIFCSVDK